MKYDELNAPWADRSWLYRIQAFHQNGEIGLDVKLASEGAKWVELCVIKDRMQFSYKGAQFSRATVTNLKTGRVEVIDAISVQR